MMSPRSRAASSARSVGRIWQIQDHDAADPRVHSTFPHARAAQTGTNSTRADIARNIIAWADGAHSWRWCQMTGRLR